MSSPPTSPLTPGYRLLTVGMIALVALGAFEALAVTTAMPTIVHELDGLALFAFAFAGPLASGVVGMVVAANWSDRSGPRTPLLVMVALFLIGVLVAGWAGDMPTVVAGRLVHGAGGGGLIVALYVVVGRAYPQPMHPRVFAAFAAAWVVPSLIGPLIAGLVTEHLGWRWVFLGVAALVVLALAAVLPALRRPELRTPPSGEPERWRWGRILVGCALALVVLALHLVSGAAERLDWPVVAGAIAVGVVGVAFTLRPLVPAGTFTVRRGLPGAVALRGLSASAYLATEAYVPLLLTERFGFTPSLAGLALTAGAVTWSLASWVQTKVPADRGDGAIVRVASVLLAGAIALVLFVSVTDALPWLALGGWALAGAGMGLMTPRFSVLVLRHSPEREQGFNSAAGTIAEYTGMAVLLAFTGALHLALLAVGGVAPFVGVFVAGLVVAVVLVALAGRVDAVAPTGAEEVADARRQTA
ncbi:MFS transporter [Diaminobutyricimonas aerilata]|nr:MFS transporter [Diaminobutyricimonas aerilata]